MAMTLNTAPTAAAAYRCCPGQTDSPTGKALPVAGTSFDFRLRKPIGSLVVDECFADLVRDADNSVRVTLADPSSGKSLVVWMDERYRYIQAFTGDTLLADRRRRGLAIEPMTCPPDAFR